MNLKRQKDESFEDFKVRRRLCDKLTKLYLKGRKVAYTEKEFKTFARSQII